MFMGRKVLKYGIGLFVLAALLAGRWIQLEEKATDLDPAVLFVLKPKPMRIHTPVAYSGSTTLNPRRFMAAQILHDGAITRLHENVVMRFPSAEVRAEDAELGGQSGGIIIHGDARLTLFNVRALPDGALDQFARLASTDLRRFGADEIKREGTITHLRGDVGMQLPGMIIHSERADMDSRAATITTHGDSRVVFLKVAIEPDDQLGPWFSAR